MIKIVLQETTQDPPKGSNGSEREAGYDRFRIQGALLVDTKRTSSFRNLDRKMNEGISR